MHVFRMVMRQVSHKENAQRNVFIFFFVDIIKYFLSLIEALILFPAVQGLYLTRESGLSGNWILLWVQFFKDVFSAVHYNPKGWILSWWPAISYASLSFSANCWNIQKTVPNHVFFISNFQIWINLVNNSRDTGFQPCHVKAGAFWGSHLTIYQISLMLISPNCRLLEI